MFLLCSNRIREIRGKNPYLGVYGGVAIIIMRKNKDTKDFLFALIYYYNIFIVIVIVFLVFLFRNTIYA